MRIDLFITENLQKEPKKLGYAQDVARMAAEYGLKHYYRASEATRKGKIFDDCLAEAKKNAKHLSRIN
ncbi:MAG: hypothetical protein J6N68_07420 [Shewanella sp.]|nr:hypothetical protein [Shewanella sp.]